MLSLSEVDRRVLLDLARESVIAAVSSQELPAIIPQGGIFDVPRGVFVTLHIRGRLRGCIGVIEAQEPLGEAVVRCAASAALHDPRFPPLRP
jgi:AMMECR1 domain-containing protein